tara:strand:- start:6224 stop:8920 length:2697 start_codon:yes stop_codon:yes gene_type:complete
VRNIWFLSAIALLFSFFGEITKANATHNKAGEITYRKLNGFTYEITITTYTDPRSSQADRCELGIFFGDGDSDTIPRINSAAPCDPSISCNCAGEILVPGRIQKNVYRTKHTYPGPSTYIITMEDPNRVDQVVNIPRSVSIPFFIRSTLVINPLIGSNNSPILTFPPIDDACICNPFYHNPGAVDPDGDSLAYSLSVCYGLNGAPIPGYTYPPALCPRRTFEIDPFTGTLTWEGPLIEGVYNACILISEYRKDSRGNWLMIGDVLRDMQINVLKCNNVPPQFKETDDICIEAGMRINRDIVATDSIFQSVTLTGTGEPLFLNSSPALFNQAIGQNGKVTSPFVWETTCEHIRSSNYQMNFKAEDSGTPVRLVNFMNLGIKIVGPAPKNVRSTAGKNQFIISWDASSCNNAIGYDVYRKIDSTDWTPDSCEIGIPGYLGYEYIGSTSNWNSTTYTDDNGGIGLFHGQIYCYRVVAIYPGKTPGYGSDETCNELPFDVPIINRNSVAETDVTNGIDSIAFAKPQDISLLQYIAPYSYNVYRSEGLSSATELIFTSNDFPDFYEIDTLIKFERLNTQTTSQTYLLELFSKDSLIGTTHTASSPFLKISSDDRKLHLSLDLQVPWDNFFYEIYREIAGEFVLIDTSESSNYIDSNLINDREYRYKMKTIGRYSIEELSDTIFNFSQIAAGIPKDTIPPCIPEKPEIESECELFVNELGWNNVNNTCNYKDVIGYNVYYSPAVGNNYDLITSLNSPMDTTIRFEELISVAGCYAISAIDSFNNESGLSPRVCVDNCPVYELPNVFTPGGDGSNDIFHPIYPWRYVKNVDMVIFNRWGQVVFETDNPEINWNGINQTTNKPCPTGVYFYVCVVNEIRLAGIIPKELKGSITLMNQSDYKPVNAK